MWKPEHRRVADRTGLVTRVTGFFTSCGPVANRRRYPGESTAHDYLEPRNWDGTLERIHHELYVAVRASRKAGSRAQQ
jgi:hypothetical protein